MCMFCVRSFFCFAKTCVFSSFVIMVQQKKELVESWLLYFYCFLNVISLSLFFASSSRYYVLICSVIVAFPAHTHLLFSISKITVMSHLTNHFISIRTIQSVFALFLTFIIKTKHSEINGIVIITIKLVHVHH